MLREVLISGQTMSSAKISDDGRYRYLLERDWGPGPRMIFCMLNPSTADATKDDPTIRRCTGFANREGCGGIKVVNLYALRSPSPSDLAKDADPFGPENAAFLQWAFDMSRELRYPLIASWGAGLDPLKIGEQIRGWVIRRHARFQCLGRTKDGRPKHPLYLPRDQQLEAFL